MNADATQNIAKTRANLTVLNIFINYRNLAPFNYVLASNVPDTLAIRFSVSARSRCPVIYSAYVFDKFKPANDSSNVSLLNISPPRNPQRDEIKLLTTETELGDNKKEKRGAKPSCVFTIRLLCCHTISPSVSSMCRSEQFLKRYA